MHSLHDLPSELLCDISAVVSPADLINFASACKRLLDCSKLSLARHRDLHRELRVIHDRNALTVPTLLRRAMDEPQTRWHIRSFEVWGSREGFSMWNNYPLDLFSGAYLDLPHYYAQEDPDKIDGRSTNLSNHTHLDHTFFDHRELARYRNFMLQKLHMVEYEVEKWMSRLKFGCDEPLKVIVLALSEGIRDLIYFYHDKSQSPQEEMSPLTMFSASLRNILLSPPESRQWPVGFKALRSITIVELGWPYRPRVFFDGPATVAPLFMLPAIAKLMLCAFEFNDETAYKWEWDEHVSTVVDLDLSFDIKPYTTCIRLHQRMQSTSIPEIRWVAFGLDVGPGGSFITS
jgi:hypothetical protein